MEIYGRYRGDTGDITSVVRSVSRCRYTGDTGEIYGRYHLRREVGEPLEQSVPLGARLQPLGTGLG